MRGLNYGITFKTESEKHEEFELIYDGNRKNIKLINTSLYFVEHLRGHDNLQV